VCKIKLFSILVLVIIFIEVIACNNSGSGGGGSGNGGTDLQSGPFSTIDELQFYLENCEGGAIESDPILLIINIDLGDMFLGTVWRQLLDVIESADKYVALDLSACSVTGSEFETHSNHHHGKRKVVSIIFPDDAESLPSGYSDPSPFSFALKELTGKNIITIGGSTFISCSKLDKVSFPKATSIEYGAFNGCSSLKNVSFPEVITIGNSAFSSCDSLEIISFPKAESIGEAAFSYCNSLESVSFPEVKSISDRSFSYCNSLESVSFPKVTRIRNYAFYYSPIISITIADDCTLTDTRIKGDFDIYYNDKGTKAGTYIFNESTLAWEGP